MARFKGITGQKFGKLTVLSISDERGKGVYLDCLCDCGNEHKVRQSKLLSGHTKSCGCYRVEATKKAKTTHGMTGTKTYNAWSGMMKRCFNKNEQNYSRYGGRGITVCGMWKKFENFYADMGEIPEYLTLDRIDNGGNYEPNNCRWATLKEQANNKRNNRFIEFNGIKKTMAQWSEYTGLTYSCIKKRLKLGWLVADALTKPQRGRACG